MGSRPQRRQWLPPPPSGTWPRLEASSSFASLPSCSAPSLWSPRPQKHPPLGQDGHSVNGGNKGRKGESDGETAKEHGGLRAECAPVRRRREMPQRRQRAADLRARTQRRESESHAFTAEPERSRGGGVRAEPDRRAAASVAACGAGSADEALTGTSLPTLGDRSRKRGWG